MKFAMLFPGQGSQQQGMLDVWQAEFPSVSQTLAQASEATGVDYGRLIESGPKDELDRTEHTQPALLAANIALWRVWCELGGPTPTLAAGHSLGEYAALVAAGALEFGDAVKLVRNRGRWMQDAVPAGQGAMAAVIGLDDAVIGLLCKECAQGQILEPVNFNSPGQVVVAGHAAAVDRVLAQARNAGARLAQKLAVSVPAHCSLMAPVAEQLALTLDSMDINECAFPVLHNLDACSHRHPADMRLALAHQVHRPVQWVNTLSAIDEAGLAAAVECGPGAVLCGLGKRALPSVRFYAAGRSPSAMRELIEQLQGAEK